MRYTLKRKSGELLEFWAPSNGGYSGLRQLRKSGRGKLWTTKEA